MTEDIDKVTFQATGEGAIETVMSFLDGFDSSKQFDSVYVEFTQNRSNVSENPGSNQRTVKDYEKSKDSKPSRIRAGSSHHQMISALSEVSDKSPVPTKSLLDRVDLPEGTAYAAMSDLYERGLVNRTDERNNNNSYEYELSSKGQEEIDRIGVFE